MNRRNAQPDCIWQRAFLSLGFAILVVAGCDEARMNNEARLKPEEPTNFYADKRSARNPVEGTVPRRPVYGAASTATTRPTDQTANFPFPITSQVLQRGQQRYNIYCTPCHGQAGYGDGMIVARGFVRPPSFHEPRLRQSPPGHFYTVMTNGFGAMYNYADRINPDDRWAIAAYIRALQLSQNALPGLLSADDRRKLSENPQ